jgi:hypothetical protein
VSAVGLVVGLPLLQRWLSTKKIILLSSACVARRSG